MLFEPIFLTLYTLKPPCNFDCEQEQSRPLLRHLVIFRVSAVCNVWSGPHDAAILARKSKRVVFVAVGRERRFNGCVVFPFRNCRREGGTFLRSRVRHCHARLS